MSTARSMFAGKKDACTRLLISHWDRDILFGMWISPATARKYFFWLLGALWTTLFAVIAVPFLATAAQSWGPLKDPAKTVADVSKMALPSVHNPWIVWPIVITLVGVTAFTFGIWIADFFSRTNKLSVSTERSATSKLSDLRAEKVPTSLRLQFLGGGITPTEIRAENILSWYVIWSGEATLEFQDENRKRLSEFKIPKTWSMFILFDRPISFRQIIVRFSQHENPRFEVKRADMFSIIITTNGDIPPDILDIYNSD